MNTRLSLSVFPVPGPASDITSLEYGLLPLLSGFELVPSSKLNPSNGVFAKALSSRVSVRKPIQIDWNWSNRVSKRKIASSIDCIPWFKGSFNSVTLDV